jgi:hypothetical protein
VEVGLELLGVPVGVLVGVLPALSTLDFREEDRGVMLELRKAWTGVERASFEAEVDFGVVSVAGGPPGRRSTGERVDTAAPAIRGVKGARPDFVGAESLGINGRDASGLLL